MDNDPIPTLRALMDGTQSPKEKIVFKYALALLEVLHGKPRTPWTVEEYRKLPDSLQLEGELLVPMKHQGRGAVRWR